MDDEIQDFIEEQKVKNVIGYHKHHYRKHLEQESWNDFWTRKTNAQFTRCSNINCDDNAVHGGHVYKVEGNEEGYCYVIPLCSYCNHKKYDKEFQTRAVKAVKIRIANCIKFADFKVEVFSNETEVENVGQSSYKTPPVGDSWTTFWKETGENFGKCSNINCNDNAEEGGHVYRVNDDNDYCYIIPLCWWCNHYKNAKAFCVRTVKAVRIAITQCITIDAKLDEFFTGDVVTNIKPINKKPPAAKSWKSFWKIKTTHKFDKCSNINCKENQAYEGGVVCKGHVYDDTEFYWYVIPLCRSCNSKKDYVFVVKAVTAVKFAKADIRN